MDKLDAPVIRSTGGTALDALRVAADTANPGASPVDIIQAAKHYYGFLSNPEGITQLNPEALVQLAEMIAANTPSTAS